jgi:ribosomal protein S18 acetylase RimI-like enzyme
MERFDKFIDTSWVSKLYSDHAIELNSNFDKAIKESWTQIFVIRPQAFIRVAYLLGKGYIRADICEVCVDPLHRGKGLATSLIKSVRDKYKEVRVAALADNLSVNKLYLSLGFYILGDSVLEDGRKVNLYVRLVN